MPGSWELNSISNRRGSLFLFTVPRACSVCGENVALYECKECYKSRILSTDDRGITSYCKDCSKVMHKHENRKDHKLRPVLMSRGYSQYSSEERTLDKQKMELFAVVCIETSHYVAFVKCGVKADSPWCFFDSMADRKGEWLFLLGWLCRVILERSSE